MTENDPLVDSTARLANEILKAHDFIGSCRYSYKYRPHLYAMSFASACILYADAFQSLLRNKQYLSTWPLVRAAIEAMAHVDKIESNTEKALIDIEFGAVDDRLSWFNESKTADLGGYGDTDKLASSLRDEAGRLKSVGAKEKPSHYDRIKAVDVRLLVELKPQSDQHVPKFLPLWKMCSQLSHLSGHNAVKFLCSTNEDGTIAVNPSKDTPDEALIMQIDGARNALLVTMCRLNSFLQASTTTKDTGEMT